jgi:hypothetical protein
MTKLLELQRRCVCVSVYARGRGERGREREIRKAVTFGRLN